jgi:hypothetical protein
MIREGNFDQETAELLQMSSRLELFDVRGSATKAEKTLSGYPYYILFIVLCQKNHPSLAGD